jgi:type IV pilus assembly protein PilN
MIRINLLPHREMRRERRKKDFIGLGVLMAIVTAALVFLVGVYNSNQIGRQEERNTFVKKKNEELDNKIKEIGSLRQEIEALKARQKAVEDLQSDRTVPVHILDELVKYTPEGIFFKQIKQEDKKLTLLGLAQSNEKVSELLRNLQGNTPWMERPELIEIKSALMPQGPNKEAKKIFEFQLSTLIKSSPSPSTATPKPMVQASAQDQAKDGQPKAAVTGVQAMAKPPIPPAPAAK